MTQLSLLKLAKQGDADAIAALMNRSLQTKDINAKATSKDGCLQIMLESARVPEQQTVVEFIRKGVTGLDAKSIKAVKVYGRRVGEDFPAWSQEFSIASIGDNVRPPSRSRPRNLVPATSVALLAFLSIGIATIAFVDRVKSRDRQGSANNAVSTSNTAKLLVEARQHVSAINRAQQAFYLEKNSFAPTVEDLGIGTRETQSYDYKIVSVDRTKSVSIATAKIDGLKSYTGAVFIVKTISGTSITVAGSCVTDISTKTPPNMPQLVGKTIECPSGSHKQ